MLTAEQHETRNSRVSASDVAPICGLHSSRGPWSVWADKQGHRDVEETSLMRLGLAVEPLVRELGADVLGEPIHDTPGTVVASDWACATPDGFTEEDGVEIKLTVWGDLGWGQEGTDQVPAHFVTQCAWGMFVTGRRRWHLFRFNVDSNAANHTCTLLDAGEDPLPQLRAWFDSGCGLVTLHHYILEANKRLEEALVKKCRAYWVKHIRDGIPPEPNDEAACRKALERSLVSVKGAAEVTPERIIAMRYAREAWANEAKAKKMKEAAKARLIKSMGGHQVLKVPGVGRVTHRANKHGAFSLRANWEKEE